MKQFNFTDTIPSCPTAGHVSYSNKIGFFSSVIVFSITALVCFVYTLIIAFKYNSVKVFNRKIRTQNISNTMWIIYFFTFGVKSAIETVRYAISTPTEMNDTIEILFLVSLVLQGVSAFGLSLSLNHQRKYRSSAPPTAPTPVDTEPLLGKSDQIIKMISISEIFFFGLFIIYLVFLFLAERFNKDHPVDKREIFTYMFLGIYIVQRIPVLVLAVTIVSHRNGNEGPTSQSKAVLLIASILHLANGLPLFAWAQILVTGTSQCLGGVISWVDIVSIFNVLSLMLFFWFLRAEYLRNMEECIWTTVSQIQDTFDFRRF